MERKQQKKKEKRGRFGGWKSLKAVPKWLDDRGQLLEDTNEMGVWSAYHQ